jgi:hypothetical protein
MSPDSPILEGATHVAFFPSTVDRLRKMGARNVVPASENLLLGPCRRDGHEHVQAQTAWWGCPDTPWEQLCAPDIRWEPPIVVWVSASPQDRLNLWRACSWLNDLGLSHRDVIILEFERRPSRNPWIDTYGCCQCVSDFSDEVRLARLAEGRPWPRARYQRAVDLWHRYTDPDPSGFARTCARGLAGFPELATVWAILSNFFARRTADGALQLSRYDELLLRRLSYESDWVYIYARGPEPWFQLNFCTGDLFVPFRLDKWASHGSSPVVERTLGPPRPSGAIRPSYRLTKRGKQIRRALRDLGDAPRLPIGGAEAYAPEAPWVLREDGRLIQL